LLVACSGSDQLVAPPGADAVQRTFVARHGIDGLREDIAWIRSLPRDVAIATSLGNGRTMSRDEFAMRLEAMVPALSQGMSSPMLGMPSPSLTSNSYSGIYGLVNGHLSLMPKNVAPYWRGYDAYGYTSCQEPSMTIAAVEGRMDDFDFVTGVPIGFATLRKESAPNYAASWVSSIYNRLIYTHQIGVNGSSTHTCQIGVPGEWPSGTDHGFIVV
jgi:hypothetical protein